MKPTVLAVLLLSVPAFAGLLEEGQKAYDNEDVEKAVSLWQRGCDGGGTEACVKLGNLYAKGREVERDWEKAEKLFKKACDAGDMRGCNNYASTLYKNNEETEELTRRVAGIYEKTCKKGFGMSCYNLGEYYLKGKGVERSEEQALALYKESCSKGYARGCFDLANLYHEQAIGSESDEEEYRGRKGEYEQYAYRKAAKDLKQSRKEALKYYTLTCKHSGAEGCDQVGRAYEEGRFGVRKDLKKAKQYYDRACEITYGSPNYVGYRCNGSGHLEGVK